jgi:hypothetical protein
MEIRMASALPVGDLSVRMRDDRHEPNGAAAPASACPEIATSIVIDAAKARFFVTTLFPCCVRMPDRREMRITA